VGNADDSMARWQDGAPEVFREPVTQPLSGATRVSSDGTVVIGSQQFVPLIWTREQGVRRLADLLGELGADLDGWRLGPAVALSDDGKSVLGLGQLHEQQRGWIALLP